MPTPLRRLVDHWPLKLASLAMAVVLWALVSAEQVTVHWIPVRVEPEVRDPRYVLTETPGPREVRVLFAGPGRVLWQLALERPTLVLPVRDAGREAYAVDADMIRLPEGVRAVAVREIRPSVVRLRVQRLASRELPVEPRFSRRSTARFLVRGTPEVTPGSVRVTGPADDLARMTHLETEPIELVSDDSATFVARVRVDTSGMRHFSVSPSSLRIRAELDVRAERVLAGVPVTAPGGQPAGTADLRVTGPSRILGDLRPEAVRVEETGDRPRVVGLPAGVQGAVLVTRRPAPADSVPRAP